MDRPLPVDELALDGGRARELTDAVLELWCELLERLPELPVAPMKPQTAVASAMAWPVPDTPMSLDELRRRLRSLVFDQSAFAGHGGFFAYVSVRAPFPARRPTCSQLRSIRTSAAGCCRRAPASWRCV